MAENGTDSQKTITPRQARAIAALLTSGTVSSAATTSGTPLRTLYRWVREDATFKAALQDAESELLDGAARRLLSLHARAIDAVAVILDAEDAEDISPALKLRAAVAVIDATGKLMALRRLEARVADLERDTHIVVTWEDRPTVFDHDAVVADIARQAHEV